MARFRNLKKALAADLAAPDWEARLAELARTRPEGLTGPLLSLRLDRDELVRWRALEGLGLVADALARERMERARVLMRTLMWYMNEESGNLGWGIPEAMACAMARHEKLAVEYASILISYARDEEEGEGNFLDHDELRQGVWWGLGRLASVRPELVRPAAAAVAHGLEEPLAMSRGCAAWTLGLIGAREHAQALEKLASDMAVLRYYRDGEVREATVADLAREALSALS